MRSGITAIKRVL